MTYRRILWVSIPAIPETKEQDAVNLELLRKTVFGPDCPFTEVAFQIVAWQEKWERETLDDFLRTCENLRGDNSPFGIIQNLWVKWPGRQWVNDKQDELDPFDPHTFTAASAAARVWQYMTGANYCGLNTEPEAGAGPCEWFQKSASARELVVIAKACQQSRADVEVSTGLVEHARIHEVLGGYVWSRHGWGGNYLPPDWPAQASEPYENDIQCFGFWPKEPYFQITPAQALEWSPKIAHDQGHPECQGCCYVIDARHFPQIVGEFEAAWKEKQKG